VKASVSFGGTSTVWVLPLTVSLIIRSTARASARAGEAVENR